MNVNHVSLSCPTIEHYTNVTILSKDLNLHAYMVVKEILFSYSVALYDFNITLKVRSYPNLPRLIRKKNHTHQ